MQDQASSPTRLTSVDVLRGLTMAAMIIVNNPGSWSAMYPPLRHAEWGAPLAPADLIFPMFIFLVGVSIPLALARRLEAGASRTGLLGQALRRAGVLFLIGVGLNLFPDFDFATLRIPGVLQRIALVFAACVLVYMTWGSTGRLVVTVALLAGYTALLRWMPVPGAGGPLLTPDMSLPVWLDDTLLGAHTWRGPGDPEGVLSTLPAIANGLLGVMAGTWLREGTPARTARRLAGLGLLLLVAGQLWSLRLPAAKEVWTASYALITTGWSLLALALCLRVVDGWGWRRGLAPVTLLGRKALTAFVAAHLLSDIAIRVVRWTDGDGGTTSLHHFIRGRLLDSWLPPEAASLMQSVLMLTLIVVVLSMLRCRNADNPFRT
jgi:predicted acyltransferase